MRKNLRILFSRHLISKYINKRFCKVGSLRELTIELLSIQERIKNENH